MLQQEKDIIECNIALELPLPMAYNEQRDANISEVRKADDTEKVNDGTDKGENVKRDKNKLDGEEDESSEVKDEDRDKGERVESGENKPEVEDKETDDTTEGKDEDKRESIHRNENKPEIEDQNADDTVEVNDEDRDKSESICRDENKQEEKEETVVTVNVEKRKVTYKNKSKESNVDTGKEACEHCDRLQENFEEILRDTFNESNKRVTLLEEQVKKLTEEKKLAVERYNQIKQRSDEITAKMAAVFDAEAELENINDEFSNTKLAKRFESLYNNKWSSLTEWLFYNIDGIEEVKMIKHLTEQMKIAYKTCNDISEKEMRVFLALEDDEPLPSAREDPQLYKVKRKYGKTEKRRNAVKKSVWEFVSNQKSLNELLTEEQTETTEMGKDKFKDFFYEFADICLLMTFSQPKLILNFDVIGERYEGSIRDRFKQYACQDTVIDMSKVKNTILEVVWPSVELGDRSCFHTKGDVIVVEEGLNEGEEDAIYEEGSKEPGSVQESTCEKEENGDGKDRKQNYQEKK